jgi:tetratricopeptide (TPR) repeat protein
MKWYLLISIIAGFLQVAAMADLATLVAKGDVHDRKFETEQALQYYLPAEKLAPDDPKLLVKIARQYALRMGALEQKAEKVASGRTALRYAERAVALAPDQCDPHLSVAICWGKLIPLLGNREKVAASRQVKASADRAVKLDPNNDYAWHILGRWHQAMANVGPATRVVVKMIYGALPAASNEEAIDCLKKALKINPKRLVHVIELGRTYAMMGDAEQAKRYIQQGLAMPNREKDDVETKQRGRQTLSEI